MDPQFPLQMHPPPGEDSTDVEKAYVSGLQAGLSIRSLLDRGYFPTNDAGSHAENPPFDFFQETGAFSSRRGASLPNLLSLESAAGSDSGLPIGNRFHNAWVQEPRRTSRHRRETVTEKTRRLQKLLPSDERMGTAAVLEETLKYIRFLEAQVSVLRSMPCDDWGSPAAEGGGGLGNLSRQQLLQAMVNSKAAQKMLYTDGCCVCSAEQLQMINASNAVQFFRSSLDFSSILFHSD